MKILFIDDDDLSVKPAVHLLKGKNHECVVTNFLDHTNILKSNRPELIVLDMMKGSADPEGKAGNEYYQSIWNVHFCPIIIYSANPSLMKDNHPLVKTVQKGKDSDKLVLTEVEAFKVLTDTIRNIDEQMNEILRKTLRDVAPLVYGCKDIKNPEKVIQYLGRRRVAAQFDEASEKEDSLHPIEQYIMPPMSASLRMGDLIRKRDLPATSPESYLVIITPSCDLATGKGRAAKVKNVLCAHCQDKEEFWKKTPIKRNLDNLGPMLTTGFKDNYCFIPGIPDKMPAMVSNLRKLELIPIETIVDDESSGLDKAKSYVRVCSIDSPFRENIAWAYLNTGSRPGMPERNMDILVSQFL